MSRRNDTPGAAELDALVELSRARVAPPDRHELNSGLAALNARIEGARVQRRRLQFVAPLILVAAVGLVFGTRSFWSRGERAALVYALEGGTLLDGGYLREVNDSGLVLTFEEGTRFDLAPGTRARLRSVNSVGARVELESGSGSFEVTPNADHRWEVEVGPFAVLVKGTSFHLAWDPRSEHFQLALKHGLVSVTGPVSGGEITLRSGQQLSVDLRHGETTISEQLAPTSSTASILLPAASATPLVVSADAAMPDAPGAFRATEAAGELRRATASKRDWIGAVAKGEWDEILHEAENAGLGTVYTTASSEELFALANAARYRQRAQLARDSLLALRRRFSSSKRAVEASFLLGRLEETSGDLAGARKWYDEYLERARQGAYASEALGRKMMLVARSSGANNARPIAAEYVRRFPTGSYARSARALLETQ